MRSNAQSRCQAFKARLKAKALREEMAKLEELQREEEKIIQQEMRRDAEQRLRAEKTGGRASAKTTSTASSAS